MIVTMGVLGLRLAAGAVPSDFWPTESCRSCHPDIVDQHLRSHHERSAADPVFQAQYFKELLPRVEAEPALRAEARACTACHEPIVHVTGGGLLTRPEQADAGRSGVTCDVCHVMVGHAPPEPGNGNYLLQPGAKKYGPFADVGDWHHAHSRFHARSEMCATCHQATNRLGLEVKSTFTEWKRSRFAASGVQCQDCHMTTDGFLTAGRPRYASGTAAQMAAFEAPRRERLFTHRFPGAHSRSQVTGAVSLSVVAPQRVASPGERLGIRVAVDNGRTGHSMPTGSGDLRQLWLEVTAGAGAGAVALPPESRWVPGSEPARREAACQPSVDPPSREEVPPGSQVYRAVFGDAEGKPTLASYRAASLLCDTRLRAGETRVENYAYDVPPEATGTITVRAVLRYLAYPGAFALALGLPSAEAVDVAAAALEVPIEGTGDARRP